jgi:hypothetical protein
MMNMNLDYLTEPSIRVPKILFEDPGYSNLSITAKLVYSLMLERLQEAEEKCWIDEEDERYVIYPKKELVRDLNCTNRQLDLAIQELGAASLLWVVAENGWPNRYYLYNVIAPMEDMERWLAERLLEKGLKEVDDMLVLMEKVSDECEKKLAECKALIGKLSRN